MVARLCAFAPLRENVYFFTRSPARGTSSAGLYRVRENASQQLTAMLRVTTPAPKAPPLLNQEGSSLTAPLLR